MNLFPVCAFICESISESVTLPSTVTSIGKGAFYACESLASLELPASVKSVGSDCFYECKALSSINIPASVSNIGKYAFCRCFDLTTIEIPSASTLIGKYAYGYFYTKDEGFKVSDTSTIKGVANSTANEYANNIGIKFIAK